MGKYLIISLVFLLDIKVLADPSGTINSINKQHTFNSITIEKGLSDNMIAAICKDTYGYIWIGTWNGVNKYDGYSISSYVNIEGDSTSLTRSTIYSLLPDSKGRFWIGTIGGLCYYNYNKDNFIRKTFILNNEPSHLRIGAMCEDKNGIIWLGTSQGLISLNTETLDYEHFPLVDAEKQGNILIMSLLLESDSIINIGTHDNGYLRYNIRNNSYEQYINIPGDKTSLSENQIETIYKDLDGNIWISTNRQGINIFQPGTKSFKRILVDETNERSKRVRSIVQDEQGRFWFGTKNGLYTKSSKGKDNFVHYAHTDHLISKLINNSIHDIYIDNSGIMWLGTYSGVNYTNLNRKKLYHFKYLPNNNLFLNNNIVHCFAEDIKGNLWIGTENGGLNVLNKRTGKYFYYTKTDEKNSLSANNVRCLKFDDNNGLWIGTYEGGLNYLDLDESKFYHYKYQEDNENSISHNIIRSLLYDSDKNIWVGTYNGLCMINGSNKRIKRFSTKRDFLYNINYDPFQNYLVRSIFEDRDGNIYVGIVSLGLFQFQKADSSFKKMDIQRNFDPYYIFQDSKNNLWMGTNIGLFLINDFIPPVCINEFLIFNKPVSVGNKGSPLQKVIERTDKIVLSWKQSVFSFGFVALNYDHPENNLYAYKMEGFDREWNYTDANRRLATYTHLDPGTYNFHVKASNNDGIWNEQFEQLVAKRTLQLEMANKELEAFAYSVSHDLRAPLRSINGFSKIILEEHKNKLDTRGQVFFNKVCNAAQHMSQLIDDILKLSRITRSEMNIRKVNLSSIANEIANDYQNSDVCRKVEFIIQKEIIVNVDEHLLRIAIENLIGNSWKFTSKKPLACIEFGRLQKGENNTYYVRDDGAGFDMKYANRLFGAFQRLHSSQDYSGTGIGLATVQRIIYRHGGKVWAEGEVEKGATFYFTLP